MTIEEAKNYWEFKYNRAKDYTDVHWEADERHEHQEYVEALQIAVKALKESTELKRLLMLAVEDIRRSDDFAKFCFLEVSQLLVVSVLKIAIFGNGNTQTKL